MEISTAINILENLMIDVNITFGTKSPKAKRYIEAIETVKEYIEKELDK